jgi:nitrate reductase beta subunit
MEDYYEPWTYDYENLITAPLGDDFPVARPKSLVTGKNMAIGASANWDDSLGGVAATEAGDPISRSSRGGQPADQASSTRRASCSSCRASASTA